MKTLEMENSAQTQIFYEHNKFPSKHNIPIFFLVSILPKIYHKQQNNSIMPLTLSNHITTSYPQSAIHSSID